MKNLKKLNKSQLKTIKGAGGIKLPEPEFCMYACPDGRSFAQHAATISNVRITIYN